MVRLERAVGAAISIIGVGIAIFMTFCVAYYFMPNMLNSDYSSMEEVLASWTPQLVITAMFIILSVGLVKLGSGLMRYAGSEERGVEETPIERGSPPLLPPRPPEAMRPPEREERPAHMAFEAAIHERGHPPAPRPSSPPAEGRAPPKPGPRAGRGAPEARPALDEDELSRIIRILRERRKRA